eukprot:GDKI01029671.1.p2 GENE.GDKI01029671.1~~GDKI01029671.1.p2  ORF type:complete len:101 (-),score=43.15 GDKI01029671.1:34-336(-)
MGKAKPAKHTAAELKAKEHASSTNMGGGKAGLQDRLGGKAGHSKFMCYLCKTPSPSLTSMKIHHDAKHESVPWDPSKYEDLHAIHGGTTQGVAVRGSTKK